MFPLPLQALHSHLNLSLPKNSSTMFLVMLVSASTMRTPVCGSTNSDWKFSTFFTPLHLKKRRRACAARHCKDAGRFFTMYESCGSRRNIGNESEFSSKDSSGSDDGCCCFSDCSSKSAASETEELNY